MAFPEGPWLVSVTHRTGQMLLLQGTCSWAPPQNESGPPLCPLPDPCNFSCVIVNTLLFICFCN